MIRDLPRHHRQCHILIMSTQVNIFDLNSPCEEHALDEWEILESYAQLSLEYWWVGQVGRTTLIQLTPLYINVQIVSVGGAGWNN